MTTDTTATETRRTPWFDCTQVQAWNGSGVSAYRIWERLTAYGRQQRHEWRMENGTTQLDEWIPTTFRGWAKNAMPVPVGEAR